MGYVLVFLGGGLGAMLRHGVNLGVGALAGNGISLEHLPHQYHRVAGDGPDCGVVRAQVRRIAGMAAVSHHRHSRRVYDLLRPFRSTRRCSTNAARSGLAALYVLGSVVLSVAGLFAGLWLIRHFA